MKVCPEAHAFRKQHPFKIGIVPDKIAAVLRAIGMFLGEERVSELIAGVDSDRFLFPKEMRIMRLAIDECLRGIDAERPLTPIQGQCQAFNDALTLRDSHFFRLGEDYGGRLLADLRDPRWDNDEEHGDGPPAAAEAAGASLRRSARNVGQGVQQGHRRRSILRLGHHRQRCQRRLIWTA